MLHLFISLGLAFEGRGFDARNIWNPAYEITIGVIGNFKTIPPNESIINAILKVFDDAMVLGKISEEYKFHDGEHLGSPFIEIMKNWCRYTNSTNVCDTAT